MRTYESEDATSMADQGNGGGLRRDPLAGDPRGGGELLPGSLHAVGARGDGTPLGGGAAGGPGTAVPGDRQADGRLDDDGDPRGALAAPRRGRLPLGAAVPEESPVRELTDLAGRAVATVYPRLTAELLPVGVTLVDVSGSVEITPRLGLADAIVDLVSSGNTLRTNGLRSIGVLLESEAVLVAGDEERGAQFAGMLRAVVEARRHRYLMLNAPESALAAIGELVRPRLPSVLP